MPPEIAGLIGALPPNEDAIVFRLFPNDLATEMFEYLSAEKQQDLLVHLLSELSPDDRTALLEELPGPMVQRLLVLLSPEQRKMAVTLLGYKD